jgi:hypothetical protein
MKLEKDIAVIRELPVGRLTLTGKNIESSHERRLVIVTKTDLWLQPPVLELPLVYTGELCRQSVQVL